eukprot:575586-Alexandrium_andersonii.AAC.1
MSASLVGSEMCIRDSSSSEASRYRALAARANCLSSDRPDLSFAAKECCCLLYTSDAADDM